MNSLWKSRRQRRFQIILTADGNYHADYGISGVVISLINSLNSAKDISRNGYAMLWTRDFTLESWKAVLGIWKLSRHLALRYFARTVIVTFLQTLITAMFAYMDFPGKSGGEENFYTAIGFSACI